MVSGDRDLYVFWGGGGVIGTDRVGRIFSRVVGFWNGIFVGGRRIGFVLGVSFLFRFWF